MAYAEQVEQNFTPSFAIASGPDEVAAAFQQNEHFLVRWLTRRVKDASEAEDIAQSAFIRVWHYAHHSEVTNAKGLLFKTAGRLALNELRRRKRHARQFTHADDFNDSNEPICKLENVAAAGLAPDESVMLSKAFASLSDNSRTAFLMHRVYGFNYAEIAAQMKVSRSSVEKYMIRALASLKETAAS